MLMWTHCTSRDDAQRGSEDSSVAPRASELSHAMTGSAKHAAPDAPDPLPSQGVDRSDSSGDSTNASLCGDGTLGRPWRRDVVAWLCTALAILAAWSFAFVPLRASQDEWWHLKAGKWMLEHRQIPTTDIFTYAGEGLRWHNHEWLSQMLFYLVYAGGEESGVGGLRALITMKALVVAVTFALVMWVAALRCGSWRIAALVSLVGADVARRTIYPRPPIVSYFLLALFFLVLWRWKQGRLRTRWLWCLPLVAVAWANLHGMAPLAVVATGAFAAGEIIDVCVQWLGARRRGASSALSCQFSSSSFRRAVILALLTGATALAVSVNPSGPKIFVLGRTFTADPILQRVIAEMLPTPGPFMRLDESSGWSVNPLYLSFWASLGVLSVLLIARRGRLAGGVDAVVLGFFTYQAVMHVRLLPLYAVACMPVLANLFAAVCAPLTVQGKRFVAWALPALTVALFVIYVFVVAEPPPQTFFRRNVELLNGKDREEADYPTPVMKFILRVGFPDRMFSEINYCGYMIWWLSPEHHKLFTDNRFDLFGSRFYLEEATVVNGVEKHEAKIGRGWDEILDAYGVNFIVISRAAPLNAKLRASGRWDEVYYWVPRGSSPLHSGFNVWLRRENKFAPVRERAERIFHEENPNQPPPEVFEKLVERSMSPMGMHR